LASRPNPCSQMATNLRLPVANGALYQHDQPSVCCARIPIAAPVPLTMTVGAPAEPPDRPRPSCVPATPGNSVHSKTPSSRTGPRHTPASAAVVPREPERDPTPARVRRFQGTGHTQRPVQLPPGNSTQRVTPSTSTKRDSPGSNAPGPIESATLAPHRRGARRHLAESDITTQWPVTPPRPRTRLDYRS
jgi:hypothetical protein